MEGFDFAQVPGSYDIEPLDVGEYTGISFWGWAAEPFPDAPLTIQVHFPNVDTQWGDKDATCYSPEYNSRQCDDFYDEVSLTQEWTQYFIPWDKLHQSRDEWSPPQVRFVEFDKHVNAVSFIAIGGRPGIMSQPFDFCISHIYFTR